MIRSMTGFGAASVEAGSRRVSIEARSVNHRYLKVQLRLPRALAGLEADVESTVQKRLRRGAVSVAMAYEDADAKPALRIDVEAAISYRRQLEALWSRLDRREPAWMDPVTPLLRLPGVVIEDAWIGEGGSPSAEIRAFVVDGLDRALDALARAREAEGADLVRILEGHAATLEKAVSTIEGRAPAVPVELRDRMAQRVRLLLTGLDPKVPVSEPDLLRELCLLADRADVAEELNRLHSHLARFRGVLAEGGEAGRRLDFLLQEMLRETNTIGSKANDAAIAHAVVEMKCEIERMKEQVQNLE